MAKDSYNLTHSSCGIFYGRSTKKKKLGSLLFEHDNIVLHFCQKQPYRPGQKQ